jgi:hypothetical protein
MNKQSSAFSSPYFYGVVIIILGGLITKWFGGTDMPVEKFVASPNFLANIGWIIFGSLLAIWMVYAAFKMIVKWIVQLYYRKQASRDIRYIRILPSVSTALEVNRVLQFVKTFGGMVRNLSERLKKGDPWFRIRFHMNEGKEIAIYLAYPQDKESSVHDTIRSIYPACEIHPITHKNFPQPAPGGVGGHFRFKRGRRKGLPLVSLSDKKESPLGDILATLRPNTILDIQFSPEGWKSIEERSEEVLEDLKEKKVTEMNPQEKAKKNSLAKRLTGREEIFNVRISLWSGHKYGLSIIRSMANAIETALKYDGAIRFYRWRNPWFHPLSDQNPIPLPLPTTIMAWTDTEFANLFHLPPGDHQIYQRPRDMKDAKSRGYLPHLQENHRTLENWELSSGAYIGTQVHPLYTREIKIDFEQLTKHFLLTGAPGMGKSSLIIDMLDGMLREWVKDSNHPGFTIIDPSQETVAVIQNRLAYMEKQGLKIPKDRIRYFDLTNRSNHYPGLNILHVPAGADIQTAADDAADVILHTTGNSDSLTEAKRILKNCIQALILDNEEHSILAIPEFLRDPVFRMGVLKRIKGKDPYVFREIMGWGDEPVENEAILNRIDPLLRNMTMRRMFGQKEWTFNIRKYMDKGYLVFVDALGLSPEGMKVTVGNLINQYHQVAKSRAKGSKYHFMMIDEAHLVQIPIIAKIIAEDRKFGFGIGLITQMVDQITNKELLTALNLIGTIITCAQNGVGASKIEKMTEGHFRKPFITRLHERHAAVFTRTKVDGESQITSCVVKNRPPIVYLPSGKEANYLNHEKGIAERYGLRWAKRFMAQSGEVKSKEEIDQIIQQYFDQIDRVVSEPGPKTPENKQDKPVKAPRVIL